MSIHGTFSDEETKHTKEFKMGDMKTSYCASYNGKFYAGVRLDAEIINKCLNGKGLSSFISCLFIPAPIIDLPFSLVADTIFLPYTAIHNEFHREVYRDDNGNICPASSKIEYNY